MNTTPSHPATHPTTHPTTRASHNTGPEIWRLARDAYLGGESAASVCRRLNLTVSALRQRATRKGWTRTRHEAACSRGDHPAEALRDLIARIAQASRMHRHDEVAAMVRTAETLARAVRVLPPAPPPPPTEPSEADKRAWREAESKRLEQHWMDKSLGVAFDLLSEPGYLYSSDWALAGLMWRAKHLGPEQAAIDYHSAVGGGWSSRYWDEHGEFWPMKKPPRSPGYMVEQHQRRCASKREKGQDYLMHGDGRPYEAGTYGLPEEGEDS